MTPAERLEACETGREPKLIAVMASGFVVLGDYQLFPGYCLLLANPIAPNLNALTGEVRTQFLNDMATLGDAIQVVTGCTRVNYSIYGNLDPFLHAHVWPRFASEDPSYATKPPFAIPAEIREAEDKKFVFERDFEMIARIQNVLCL